MTAIEPDEKEKKRLADNLKAIQEQSAKDVEAARINEIGKEAYEKEKTALAKAEKESKKS